MDHAFRGIPVGLIEKDTIPFRKSREEFTVIVDPYAKEAIDLYVPMTLRFELEGWARSYYSLEQHINAILAYKRPKLSEPVDTAWLHTKQYVTTYFRRLPVISSLSYHNFDDVKWINSSAAGYGYQGSKGEFDNYSKAKQTAVTLSEMLDHDRSYVATALIDSTPDVAFTRTQLSLLKVKAKIRNVWGEAFHYVLLEGLFADPLISLFKRTDTFYFIGKDPLLTVPILIEEILKAKDYVYMFDWSQFDATVQEWEIRFAFECLEALLVFPSNVEHQIWRFIIELFIYRKIASPNGVLYLKTQGIPSGSCFTNVIGSITNFVRIQYMFYRLTNRFAEVFTHGDDSLCGVETTQFIPLEMFETICSLHDWKINLSKTEVSRRFENVSFLSRQVRERQATRDELVCLRMLMYPEYPVPAGNVSALRAKSILHDAGSNSRFLYTISNFLKAKYGYATHLPVKFMLWNFVEFEARKTSASELL